MREESFNTPTVFGELIKDSGGRIRFMCRFCKCWHNHGSIEGYTKALCRNKENPTPYETTGYYLKIDKFDTIESVKKHINRCTHDMLNDYHNHVTDIIREINILKYKKSNVLILKGETINRWLGIKPGQLDRKYMALLDHSYFISKNGIRCLVGEPYNMNTNTLHLIIEFCEKFGLNFYQGVKRPSIYFPNHTVVLVFSKKQKPRKNK